VEDYAEISATRVRKAMDITSLDAAIAATADVVMLHPREKEAPAATAYAILELAALGGVLPSSAPVHLPESEPKYVVTCIHHIMPKYVFPHQFSVQNTIEDQRLDNIYVSMASASLRCYEKVARSGNTKTIKPPPAVVFIFCQTTYHLSAYCIFSLSFFVHSTTIYLHRY
jgi:hypothetical protein